MASSPGCAHRERAGEAQSTCAVGHDASFRVLTGPGRARVTSVLLGDGGLCVAHIRLFLDVALERVCEEPDERALTPAARRVLGE